MTLICDGKSARTLPSLIALKLRFRKIVANARAESHRPPMLPGGSRTLRASRPVKEAQAPRPGLPCLSGGSEEEQRAQRALQRKRHGLLSSDQHLPISAAVWGTGKVPSVKPVDDDRGAAPDHALGDETACAHADRLLAAGGPERLERRSHGAAHGRHVAVLARRQCCVGPSPREIPASVRAQPRVAVEAAAQGHEDQSAVAPILGDHEGHQVEARAVAAAHVAAPPVPAARGAQLFPHAHHARHALPAMLADPRAVLVVVVRGAHGCLVWPGAASRGRVDVARHPHGVCHVLRGVPARAWRALTEERPREGGHDSEGVAKRPRQREHQSEVVQRSLLVDRAARPVSGVQAEAPVRIQVTAALVAEVLATLPPLALLVVIVKELEAVCDGERRVWKLAMLRVQVQQFPEIGAAADPFASVPVEGIEEDTRQRQPVLEVGDRRDVDGVLQSPLLRLENVGVVLLDDVVPG
mmetsp:Transcript_41406/g.107784  ORF Transcript_41406/g.107784 Transcript_41406/m.107784 type:complete len:469 (-) Transcript_41406:1068-2474(-)